MKFSVLTIAACMSSFTNATNLNATINTELSVPVVQAVAVPWSDKSIKKLDLKNKFKPLLEAKLDALNKEFLKSSLAQFENYCTLETIQLIFE